MRRFHCETADWHVFARGARRLRLFRDDDDYREFVKYLASALKSSGCVLWAFALMSNHYHLVLRGSSDQLTDCMHRLNLLYSTYHNKRYALDGHTFDGPYQAYRQTSGLLMLHRIAYVFFNPVKAGLCADPADYTWSCYRIYANLPGSPLTVDPGKLFESISIDPVRGWARFWEALRVEERRVQPSRPGKPTMLEVHREQFRWLLDYAQQHQAELAGEDPAEVAIYWGGQCGIAPRAMALESERPPEEIRNAQRRLARRIASDPHLAAVLALP